MMKHIGIDFNRIGIKVKRKFSYYCCICLMLSLIACGTVREQASVDTDVVEQNDIPELVNNQQVPSPILSSPVLPEPEPVVEESLHTVVASGVSARELLFALTRDADINLDIDDDVNGLVTINAVNQPFSMILDRISRSVNLRYEMKNNVLRISKDKPFLRNYSVDYLNMSRSSIGKVNVSTQLGSTGGGTGDSGGGGSNGSETALVSEAANHFWKSLEDNINGMLGESSGQASAGSTGGEKNQSGDSSAAESSAIKSLVYVNKEAGILTVRATGQQHKEINQFLSEISNSAQRQVLIEATIAEVTLNETYQAGIDWSQVQQNQ